MRAVLPVVAVHDLGILSADASFLSEWTAEARWAAFRANVYTTISANGARPPSTVMPAKVGIHVFSLTERWSKIKYR
jgi:hypothetical protein